MIRLETGRRSAGITLLLLLSSCAFELQPERNWPEGQTTLSENEVLLSWQYDLKGLNATIRGVGVILHSSPERGTYLLANWHVVCAPMDLVEFPAGANAEGPVGRTITVSVHTNARETPGHDKGWQDHQGTVVIGKMKVLLGWVLQKPEHLFESPWLDMALVHLEKDCGLFKAVKQSVKGAPKKAQHGYLRGIDYHSGTPYAREIFFLSESAFINDGIVASGSAVYNDVGELVGSLAARRPVEDGRIEDTRDGSMKIIRFKAVHYFTPLNAVRKELESTPYAFLLESSKAK